jgi:nucleotide-binding universal stress UspA family protein
MIAIKNVLVPTDFGDASDAALSYGRELARQFGGTLHVLHVVDSLGAMTVGDLGVSFDYAQLQDQLEQASNQQLKGLVTEEDRKRVPTTLVCRTSYAAAAEILEYAREAKIDLIVMGTHGRGAFAHVFMGSVAERVVRLSPCPVLTVKHPEHEFLVPDALQAVKANIPTPR